MTLDQIVATLEVARTGSINRAAQKLYISQPALTKAIKSIEAEFGQPLFVRSHAGMKLTAYGEFFVRSAENIVKNYDLLRSVAQTPEAWEYPTLRVMSVPIRFAGTAFTRVADQYSHSACNISYKVTTVSECFSAVKNGGIDVALISLCSLTRHDIEKEMARDSVHYEHIRDFEPSIVLSFDNPLSKLPQDEIERAQLAPLTLFSTYEQTSFIRRDFQTMASELGVHYAPDSRDPRMGLSDFVRADEFRCNLDSKPIYDALGRPNEIHACTRSLRLAGEPPFLLEIGFLYHEHAVQKPPMLAFMEEVRAISRLSPPCGGRE